MTAQEVGNEIEEGPTTYRVQEEAAGVAWGTLALEERYGDVSRVLGVTFYRLLRCTDALR